ncbi:MAG TPA: KOW motif-containing protein, partial [Kofleriaceae bacterium]
MQVGDLCEVLGGPFEGKSGIVRGRDLRRHSVSLEIPTFEGTRSIELADLVVIADSLAGLEVEAAAVITASARA